MRKILIWIVFFILLSFTERVAAYCDTCACPPPEEKGHGWRLPYYGHMYTQLSYDGRYLLSEPGYRLDLSTLELQTIELASDLPKASLLGYYSLTWSPYSSDLIILIVPMMVDTSKDGSPVVSRQNLFKYQFSTKQSWLLSPDAAGPFGPERMRLVHEWNAPWLAGSTVDSDTFRLGYSSESGSFAGFYVPQTQQLIAKEVRTDFAFYRESHDRKHAIWGGISGMEVWPYYLDSQEIGFPVRPDQVTWASFSPDGSLFALDLWPEKVDTNKTYRQVWIYRTDDPSEPIHRINFQELHCMYSFHGIWPEFITDSTLAVSMHKDGDISSPLWEIALDGRIIRQLTFLPTNTVTREERSRIQRYVRVATDVAHIEIVPSSSIRTLTLVNTVGQSVPSYTIEAGEESGMIDVRGLPMGLYFGHISGTREILHVLIER